MAVLIVQGNQWIVRILESARTCGKQERRGRYPRRWQINKKPIKQALLAQRTECATNQRKETYPDHCGQSDTLGHRMENTALTRNFVGLPSLGNDRK
jgi:hypothetical protein